MGCSGVGFGLELDRIRAGFGFEAGPGDREPRFCLPVEAKVDFVPEPIAGEAAHGLGVVTRKTTGDPLTMRAGW